jgi:homoserine dehydrogenase
MLAQSIVDESTPTTKPAAARTIRVGLIGLGNVNQAVARLAPETERLSGAGVRLRVVSALVRDVGRVRRCPRPARVSTNAEGFLRGHYDVVIEALGPIEPARTLVARLLGRGVPVVTANKALVAAHGRELTALAARRATSFRYEASALAGVPFLGALAERPHVADVSQFAAIVNGTSNFVLSTIEHQRSSFDAALERAQALGLTEPDPSRDLDGLDAADKFSLLASLFGWGDVPATRLEVRGIGGLDVADLDAARRTGHTIKPVVYGARSSSAIDAFVGPALVPLGQPLAALSQTLSGIQFSGRFVRDLFFSGPGAGPEVTAATLLDDAIEAVSTVRRLRKTLPPLAAPVVVRSPNTGWFVRVQFPGVVPDAHAAQGLFAAAGLTVVSTVDGSVDAQWLSVAPMPPAGVQRALAQLRHTHRLALHAIRRL